MLGESGPVLGTEVVVDRMEPLDSHVINFWKGFPCPPPWREELLFRMNWTGCLGSDTGERVKLYMADKCQIRHDGQHVLPDPGSNEVLMNGTCTLTCQLIISLVSVLFIALLTCIVVFCVRRKRAKAASPSHQSALTAHPDNTKFYTSCHYACAPIVARQLQTRLSGSGTETRVLPDGSEKSPYQPGCYPQSSGYHLAQPPTLTPTRVIQTPYGPVPTHTSSLVVPTHPGARVYRKLDTGHYSTSSASDRGEPVYESIGDSESIRGRGSECEFCECEHLYSDQHIGMFPDQHSVYPEHGPGMYPEHRCVYPHSGLYPTSPLVLTADYQGDNMEEPMGNGSRGYLAGRGTQTLPLRPMKNNVDQDIPVQYPDLEPEELLPLKDNDEEGKARRRPSSGSSFSNYSGHNQDGKNQRRIPALHPHYFVASGDEAS